MWENEGTSAMQRSTWIDVDAGAHVEPLDFQVDPGELDFRRYRLSWGTDARFAEMIATHTAGLSYRAGYEYWLVDRSALALRTELVVHCLGDLSWGAPLPAPPASAQEFVAPTLANWVEVAKDITMGALYKHGSRETYVRIAIAGSGADTSLVALRWYQQSKRQPAPTMDPSGVYRRVSRLASGPNWFADSKAPI